MKGIKLTCPIEKKNDHYSLKLPEDYQKAMHELMRHCFEKKGGYCSFSIMAPKRTRSTGDGSQSHHFNGHVQQIATCTGQPFEDVKKYLKAKAIGRGYPILMGTDKAGNETDPILDLWGNGQGISEADCTVEECCYLIEESHQLADEMGLKLIEEKVN